MLDERYNSNVTNYTRHEHENCQRKRDNFAGASCVKLCNIDGRIVNHRIKLKISPLTVELDKATDVVSN